MRKVVNLVLWIIVAVLAYKIAPWAYQQYMNSDQGQAQQIYDSDIICAKTPDTGQCVCRHRETFKRIPMNYDECVSRAAKSMGIPDQ